MTRGLVRPISWPVLMLALLVSAAWSQPGSNGRALDSKMGAIEPFLMERSAEIELARSAAPASVSQDAEVMVLGRRGYETAMKGKNGFVCLVERGWAGNIGGPDFWNPKIHGPLCLNPAAARTYLPLTLRKTELVLAGQSEAQMGDSIKAALEKKELPALETGAMCYMMANNGYLSTEGGHWHSHLMFFIPQASAETWGANLPGSPMMASEDPADRLTIFMVRVGKWSDGTPDHAEMQ